MTKDVDLNQAAGQRIRMLRKLMGLSQTELAGRLNFSYQQLQKYETGKNNISINTLEKISHTLNTTPTELLSKASEVSVSMEGHNMPRVKGQKMHELISSFNSITDPQIQKNLMELIHAIEAVEDIQASPGS